MKAELQYKACQDRIAKHNFGCVRLCLMFWQAVSPVKWSLSQCLALTAWWTGMSDVLLCCPFFKLHTLRRNDCFWFSFAGQKTEQLRIWLPNKPDISTLGWECWVECQEWLQTLGSERQDPHLCCSQISCPAQLSSLHSPSTFAVLAWGGGSYKAGKGIS